MKKFRNSLLAAAGLGVLVIVLEITGVGQADAQPPVVGQRVTVINEDDSPVPVSAPNPLPVQQSGNWTVSLSAVENRVLVDNPTTDPVQVQHVASPGWEPFFEKCESPLGEAPEGECLFFIPSGKRLVVELVTVSFWAEDTGIVDVTLNQCKSGISGTYVIKHTIAMSRYSIANFTPLYWEATQPVKIYADYPCDDGSIATLNFEASHFEQDVIEFRASISGHLEDAP